MHKKILILLTGALTLSINRNNIILIRILRTDLGSEIKDVPPYRAGIRSCKVSPYCFVELFWRKNFLLVFGKESQQRKFCSGKSDINIIQISMPV